MNKWIEKIKEYWKDPVWSKVIAAGIIFVLGAFFTSLYAIFKSIFSEISFIDTFKSIRDYLVADILMPTWTLALFGIVFLTIMLKPIVSFLKETLNKIRKPKLTKPNDEVPSARQHSTVLFSYRMAKAFPGLRDLAWFNDPEEAIQRLQLLLNEPLQFKDGSREHESDPFWWFRGHSALFIDKFKKLGCKKVLMDIYQLKIKRIAAFHSNSYYRDFVYVEAFAEKQSGLYNLTDDDIQKHIEKFGYSWEEYGLIKFLHLWKKPIRREHYDDGATIIRGRVVNAENAELRVRYTSDYNFIIAAKGSPYNSKKFSSDSKQYLDGLLRGEVEFDDFFAFMQTLEKKEM